MRAHGNANTWEKTDGDTHATSGRRRHTGGRCRRGAGCTHGRPGCRAGAGARRKRTAGDAGGRRAVEAGTDQLGPVGSRRRDRHSEPDHVGETPAGRGPGAGGPLRLARPRRRNGSDDRRSAPVSGHSARDHGRRDSRGVPRVHPHASRFPEPQLHRRRGDLQQLPAGSRGGRGAGRPRQEHRAQRKVRDRDARDSHRHGTVPERAVPGARNADLHRGSGGLGGGHRGDGVLRRRGGHPHRALGPARRRRPLGRRQRGGRPARVGHSVAEAARHRAAGRRSGAGHGAGRRRPGGDGARRPRPAAASPVRRSSTWGCRCSTTSTWRRWRRWPSR